MEDIPEHAPRKRYPDPVRARHISKRVSTIVEEPRRPKTPQVVVQQPGSMPVKPRPPSRAEQLEDKPRHSRQGSTKVDGDFVPTKMIDLVSPEAAQGTRDQLLQSVSRRAPTRVVDGSPQETTETRPDRGGSRVSVKVSSAPAPGSKSRAATPISSQTKRSDLSRSEKLPESHEGSRNSSREQAIALSAGHTPENRLRESSHGSAWTESQMSTPDSRNRRNRRDLSPEAHRDDDRDHRGRAPSSDERLQRGSRRRSPSPPLRQTSMQGPAGYMGMKQMIPQQPFPGQVNPGQMIHPPMMPPAGYRAIMPPPPPRSIMARMPRSLPPPIMSPPQAPFPWINNVSPPMTNWVHQRPNSGIPSGMVASTNLNSSPSMGMRHSLMSPGQSYGNIGNAGTRRRGRPIESMRTPRDGPIR